MGHFQLFLMILKFSMGHFLSFYIDFYGPFSKLMGLWRMAPCLPNHCKLTFAFKFGICFAIRPYRLHVKLCIHMTKSQSDSDSVCQRRRESLTVSMNLKWKFGI